MGVRVGGVVDVVSCVGGTPLVVVQLNGSDSCVLGVVDLREVVEGGMEERFAELRRMGIEIVVVSGGNPLTAKAIAGEAGGDDVLAEATPEGELALIGKERGAGRRPGAWWSWTRTRRS